MSSFTAPHFNLPFRLRQTADCVEQDTIEDIANCVVVLLRTHFGQRPEAPDFGVSDYTFKTQPISQDLIRDEIASSEPRVQAFIDQRPELFDELIARINIELRTGGGQ